MRALSSLRSLLAAFSAEKIAAVTVKGFGLSQLAYDDPLVRQSKDIDLLVAPADFERAAHLVEEMGYHRNWPPGLPVAEAMRKCDWWFNHMTYMHPATDVWVELHWRLTSNRHLFNVELPQCETAQIALPSGFAVPALTGNDLLLYLCAHGASHGWHRLKWLADVYALMRNRSTDEHAQLRTRANALQLGRPLQQAVDLIEEVFGKFEGWPASARNRSRSYLLGVARDAMLGHDNPGDNPHGNLPVSISQFRLKPSLRYKFREAMIRVPVGGDDFKTNPLLHVPRRATQWASRHMRRLWKARARRAA